MKTSTTSTCSLCLGALACAGAAHAQVTLYGRANIDYERISLSGTPAADAFDGNQRVSSNSSRFGIRFSKDFEELKLKVIAQLENGVSWDAGGDTLAGRDTFAGAEGAWGRFRIGKMDSPMKDLGGLTDRFKGTGIQDDGSIALLGGSGNGFGRRLNNSLRYDSPVLNGWRGAVQYSLDNEDAGNAAQRRVLSLNGEYAFGKSRAALGHERHSNFNAPGLRDEAWRLSGNFEFGVVNIGASINQLSYELAAGDVDRRYATLTAGIPAGNGTINLRYGKAGGARTSAPAGTQVAGGDGTVLFVGNDGGATQTTIGYEYNLVKGMQLYGYWTKIDNGADANYRFGVNALNVAAADRGADPSGIVLGLIVDF